MRAHVVENGVVVNTVEVESLDFMPNLVDATDGGIGWSYAGGVFVAPEVVLSEEEKAQQARRMRDSMLSESDWTQIADAPVDKAEWAAYRQALRDIPQQAGFPTLITWPEKP